MSGCVLIQSSVAQLFFVSADGVTPDRQRAYLLPTSITPPAAPLTLSQAWTSYPAGCFFLLGQPVAADGASEAAFARAAWAFLSDPSRQYARLTWIVSPAALAQGLSAPVLIVTSADGTTYQTSRAVTLELRNLALLIGRGCTVAPGGDGQSLLISQPSGAGLIALLAQWGAARLADTGGQISLPLCGAQAGCLQLALTLHPASAGRAADLDTLDVGLRLFYRNPTLASDSAFFLISQRYPVFDAADGNLTLYPTLDPLSPLDAARSFFAFSAPGSQAPGSPRRSHYRTNLGYTIRLTPQPDARLVLATRPSASAASANDPLYLTPSGSFAVAAVDVGTPSVNLMCGLSGVEYVRLATSTSTTLRFVPGQGAYAPGFAPGQPPAADGTAALTTSVGSASTTTAWAYLGTSGSDPLTYYAQPDRATIYTPEAPPQQANPDQAFLFYKELRAAELPPQPPAPTSAFPLLPYVGVSGAALDAYQQLELQVVSPTRRAAIHALNLQSPRVQALAAGGQSADCTLATDDVLGATPQGLIARFSKDADDPTWKQLILFQDQSGQQIMFQCLADGTPLRSALQSNQLCLVISNPAALQGVYAGSTLAIGQGLTQWSFQLGLGQWPTQSTILVLKFADQPLANLVRDPNTWTLPASFNSAPQDISAQLQRIISDAVAAYSAADASPTTKLDYAYFVERVVSDPAWQGVIALRVAVPLAQLPPELVGLAAGINADRFYAHHLGVEISPIDTSGGTLTMKPSALFGLIDYSNPDYPPPNDSGYNFKVDTLRVLFRNAQVANFSSQIEVTLDQLFGEPTMLLNSPSERNNVLLSGRYEVHNGQPAYTFAFSGDNIFVLSTSHIFNDIEIFKAQFTTTVPAGGFQPGDTVQSRFAFWGQFNFEKLERLDLFSFGSEIQQNVGDDTSWAGQFLSFANLGMTMSFRWGAADQRTFSFDPSALTFDTSRSQPRRNSLFANFPLKLARLIFSTGDQTVGDLGYAAVQSPLVSPGLGSSWYGLVYDLELGSVGALAGNAGLTVSLLTAWSPDSEQARAFLGLSLPGSRGKNEISLQGILKLVFGSIQLVVTGSEATGIGYLLKLKNIALKFLALSFPPNGQTEIIIFGDPNPATSNRTLGWYAAYAQKPQPPAPKPPQPPQLPPP